MMKKTKSEWQSLNPDMVIINGKIVTVDSDFSVAEAVAAKDDKITGVGSNADIKKLVGENTQVMDLKGATVLPGINDAHCHLNGFGLERPPMQLDLGYPVIKSIADIKAAAAARIKRSSPGKWISGWGWDRGFLEKQKATRTIGLPAMTLTLSVRTTPSL